ncbi:MAG: hypothetical protein ACR2LM_18380 [Pyrinomonadaceae bacterium]
MTRPTPGKLEAKDEWLARVLKWIPWLSFFFLSLALPVPLLVLYLRSASTDTAAVFLGLSLAALGVGILAGALVMILLLLYRRRWHSGLRDRLALDGITASEVSWFMSELTSEERKVLKEIQVSSPLLADAYCETLASRLNASRIITRSKRELLRVERHTGRARSIVGADTSSLLEELSGDRVRLQNLQTEATARLAEAKAQLQIIEAAASRSLGQAEADLMLRRLNSAQAHLPLAIEMAKLEQQISKEIELPIDQP